MPKFRLILLFIFLPLVFLAQTPVSSFYWVKLKDKKGTPYQISKPESFLSQRAIDRRIRQHLSVDETDLPVSQVYVDSLKKRAFEIIHSSKWLNGVTVKTADTAQVRKIKSLPFVVSVELTKPGTTLKSASLKFDETEIVYDLVNYGAAISQLTQLNGQYLHQNGFRGKGIRIAVLDAGFWHVNEITAFDSLRATNRILATRDLVDPKSDIYQQHSHGMSVLSCMGGNIPGKMIGTAPDASYYLIRTEDAATEYPIEEDNWLAGAELADSLGADVINSSLGYSTFDDAAMNHLYADMDGKKTRITQGANLAFQKGILVVTSAGNEATNSWKRIIAPSDGENVIGVAAVDKNGGRAPFSSVGPAFGGAVKPNVAALGWNTYLVTSSGVLGNSSGTSFSSPVLAGMIACLLQANSYASAVQVKKAIEQSANQYSKPDSLLGYGIPDFGKADKYLKINFSPDLQMESEFAVLPNPFRDHLLIRKRDLTSFNECLVSVYNLQGICLKQEKFANSGNILMKNLEGLPVGVLIMTIQRGSHKERFKLIKTAW
jgi:hypothetical protein